MLISAEDDEDETANKMAEDFLIPRDKWNGFILSNDFSLDSIKSFSKEVGILPSIVLGRLHKENKVPYGTYDKTLNVSYKIVSIK